MPSGGGCSSCPGRHHEKSVHCPPPPAVRGRGGTSPVTGVKTWSPQHCGVGDQGRALLHGRSPYPEAEVPDQAHRLPSGALAGEKEHLRVGCHSHVPSRPKLGGNRLFKPATPGRTGRFKELATARLPGRFYIWKQFEGEDKGHEKTCGYRHHLSDHLGTPEYHGGGATHGAGFRRRRPKL